MNPFSGQRFRASLKHFLLGRALQGLVTVVFTLMAVRAMTVSDYGIYLVVVGLADLIRPLSSLGILPVAQQFLPEMATHATVDQFRRFVRCLRLARGAMLALAAVVLLLTWQSAISWIGFPDDVRVPGYLACLVIVGLLAAEFVETLLEALLDQKHAQIARLVYALGRLIGLFALMATHSLDATNMLWVEAGCALGCWLLAEVMLYRQLATIRPDGQRVFRRGEIVRFGWQMAGSQLLNTFAAAGALRLVVARVLGLEAAGQFGFMQSLLAQVNKLLPSLLLVNLVRPMLIAARLKGEGRLLADACGLLCKSNVLLVWPIVPLVFIGGDAMVAALSGGKVQGAGLTMTAMSLALVSMAQAQVNAIVLTIHKRSDKVLGAGLLAPLVPFFVAIGSLYSLTAAAAGLFLAMLIRASFTTWLIQASSARMQLDTRGLMRFALALGVAFVMAWLARNVLPAWGGAVVFGLTLLVQLPLVKPLVARDVAILQAAVKRNLNWLRPLVSASGN